ncbi:hypothetical protein [Virgibacillus ainsalahensis]
MLKSHYVELLKSVEMFKEETMRRLYELEPEGREDAVSSNPLARTTPHYVNGYPVFQFSYDGMLPLYKENDRDYASFVRNYYHRITFESYNYAGIEMQFNQAVLVIQHYFQDNIIRDLDNRNRKYIIDAIRYTRLVKDDNWKELSILEEGLPDKQNHIQVYLLAEENRLNFLSYLKSNQHRLKQIPEVGKRRKVEYEHKQHSLLETQEHSFLNDEKPFPELWDK